MCKICIGKKISSDSVPFKHFSNNVPRITPTEIFQTTKSKTFRKLKKNLRKYQKGQFRRLSAQIQWKLIVCPVASACVFWMPFSVRYVTYLKFVKIAGNIVILT